MNNLQTAVEETMIVSETPAQTNGQNTRKLKSTRYEPIQQVKDYLERNYALRYNVLSHKIEYAYVDLESGSTTSDFQELGDERFYSMLIEIQSGSENSITNTLLRTVLASDFVRQYNPLVEYLKSVGDWNQSTDYIQMLSDRIPTENIEYRNIFFKKWFVGIIACAIDTKIENQSVLILKGGQGIGKSRFLRMLLPERLSGFIYEGNLNPNNKEHVRHMAEKLLLIMDEFDSISERQSDALKSMITRRYINYRKPYAITSINVPRIGTICGSTNRGTFLRDSTGSRRFSIINVTGNINNDPIEFLDQAFAQAYHLFMNGFIFYLSSEEIELINETNQDFEEVNAEEEMLLDIYRPSNHDEAGHEYITASQIAFNVSKAKQIKFSPRLAQKIGTILSNRSFVSGKSNGSKKYLVARIDK